MAGKVTAIILGAGSSSRMGFDKMSLQLGDCTVLEKSLLAFDSHPLVDDLVLVYGQNREAAQQAAARCKKPIRLVEGGATRADSCAHGVQAAQGEYVAFHDGARPFVSETVITGALERAFAMGAAAPAVPVKDTIKLAQGSRVEATPDRSLLYSVQTPQCFEKKRYLDALNRLNAETAAAVTDDCSILELAGYPVELTAGDYANWKLTTVEDLPHKEKKMRIGHGYDVHKLVEGRRLILGGVEIPFEKGLLGHSDADVLAHAIMDAVLGAAALGDIGKHFPDTDPAYAGADSLMLARHVAKIVKEQGYTIGNIDSTILCQRPKLAPHIEQMRLNLADAFGIEPGRVSVKATTEEKLGFTGEGLGIAVHAVALLEE